MRFVFKPRVASAVMFGECIEERIHSVFRPHAGHLSSVTVRLTDLNGPATGSGRQCRIDMVSTEAGRVSVSVQHEDWRPAFDAALVRAAGALRRRIQRIRRLTDVKRPALC